MKFHRLLPILLPSILLLAACQPQQSDAPANQDPPPAQSTSAGNIDAKPKTTKAKPFREALPAAVSLSFPYHARSVKNVQAKDGTAMQRFTLEFLGGTLKGTVATLTEDMAKAGFTATESRKRKNGYRISFTKEGYGEVIAVIRKGKTDKYRHANAKGGIQLYFPEPAQAPQG